MGSITLNGMQFFAYHGCHEEEQKTGNKFIVKVKFSSNSDAAEISDDISKTVDYQKVYNIIKAEMEINSKLIEHVTRRIIDALFKNFPEMDSAEVTVAKLNPPLGGKVKKVQYTLQRKAK
ncbi:MAG TPA: dihydroneopterin aldolase [Bacteroidales bacterium]|nr:dihydroneopterin aldolase [Bacteroidales bacterium]HPS18123.1 dihydroneopterin aldolase [Bacteroidales bacterium]